MSADHGAVSSDSSFGANGSGSPGEAQQQLNNFWAKTMEEIRSMKPVSYVEFT